VIACCDAGRVRVRHRRRRRRTRRRLSVAGLTALGINQQSFRTPRPSEHPAPSCLSHRERGRSLAPRRASRQQPAPAHRHRDPRSTTQPLRSRLPATARVAARPFRNRRQNPLEISVTQSTASADRPMSTHIIARHRIVGAPSGPCVTRACRCSAEKPMC